MLQGAAALSVGSRYCYQTRDGQLITSQHAEKGESHLKAKKWLICNSISEIYRLAFDAQPEGSVPRLIL
jgi:hypothetical protein